MTLPALAPRPGAVPRFDEAAVVEQLAELAARTDDEAEAEAFLGALGSLATTAFRAAAPMVAKALPVLGRTVADVGRTVWRHPETRGLVAALPAAARRTAADLAGAYARNPALSGQQASQVVAKGVSSWLRHPDRQAVVMREHHRKLQQQLRAQQAARAARDAALRAGRGIAPRRPSALPPLPGPYPGLPYQRPYPSPWPGGPVDGLPPGLSHGWGGALPPLSRC